MEGSTLLKSQNKACENCLSLFKGLIKNEEKSALFKIKFNHQNFSSLMIEINGDLL